MKYLTFISVAMLLAVGACSKTDQNASSSGAMKEQQAPAAAPAATEQAAPATAPAEAEKKPEGAPAK